MCLGGRPLCYLPFLSYRQEALEEGGKPLGRGRSILVPSLRTPSVWLHCCFQWSLQLLESLQMNPFFWGGKAVMAM